MNNVVINGTIQDIKFSHRVNTTDYYKAKVIVPRHKDTTDVITVKFKLKENTDNYNVGDRLNIMGSVRSHNTENGTDVYIYSHLDKCPDNTVNRVEIDGRICKLGKYDTEAGKYTFVLANNIYTSKQQKINNYIPCIAWHNVAKRMSELPVSTQIKLYGKLQTHTYRKDDNEYLVTQLVVQKFEVVE